MEKIKCNRQIIATVSSFDLPTEMGDAISSTKGIKMSFKNHHSYPCYSMYSFWASIQQPVHANHVKSYVFWQTLKKQHIK